VLLGKQGGNKGDAAHISRSFNSLARTAIVSSFFDRITGLTGWVQNARLSLSQTFLSALTVPLPKLSSTPTGLPIPFRMGFKLHPVNRVIPSNSLAGFHPSSTG
jgi:hypothetical protein